MQLYYSDQLVCKIEFLNIIYITRSNGIYVVHSESRMVTPSTIFDQSVTDLCFVWFGFVPVVWLKGLVTVCVDEMKSKPLCTHRDRPTDRLVL